MNTSSENFESTFNSLENFNNINTPLTENFSWIKPREPKVFCGNVYCGIPMEKAFAKYENRNFTRITSKYGFNAPVFNEKRSMKFKSLASELQNVEYPKDKRGFTAVSSPSGFSEYEPIQGLYKDITLDGAIKSKLRGKRVTSPKITSSEYSNFRSSTNKTHQRASSKGSSGKSSKRSSERNLSSAAKSSIASSIVRSFYPSVTTTSSPKKKSKKSKKSKKVVSSVPSSSVKSSPVSTTVSSVKSSPVSTTATSSKK
jgi:hypothetical protein